MSDQPAVFLESTALIDLVFKDLVTQNRVLAALGKYSHKVTSRYVLYEVCRGYLQNFIQLYNRSIQCHNYADLLAYTRRLYMKPHMLSSVLECYEQFFRAGNLVDLDNALPQNVQVLHHLRAFLRRHIRQGWTRMHRIADEVINDVGCRQDLRPPIHDGAGFKQDLKTSRCGQYHNCELKLYVHNNLQPFSALLKQLQALHNPDHETTRRVRAMRELIRKKKDTDFARNDCWHTSDAIIAQEVPYNVTVLTSNANHYLPLVTALGKAMENY